jgi:hypothetical protein
MRSISSACSFLGIRQEIERRKDERENIEKVKVEKKGAWIRRSRRESS